MRIETKRLILRPFEESDYDDLFEFLSQLEKDEFEGCPGITYENGKEHLAYRLGSDEYFAIEQRKQVKSSEISIAGRGTLKQEKSVT